jgi:hypothetical protein
MPEIEFRLSSWGPMLNEDSSTLPDQKEDRGDEGGLFEFVLIKVFSTFAASLKMANRCQFVLEAMSPFVDEYTSLSESRRSRLGRTAPTRTGLCFPGNDAQQLLWIGSPFLWFKKMVISCLQVMKSQLF